MRRYPTAAAAPLAVAAVVAAPAAARQGRTPRRRAARAGVAGVAVGVAAVLALTACSGASTAARVGKVPDGLAVQAYAVPSPATTAAFEASADAVDVVGVSGVGILADGASMGTAGDDALALLDTVHDAGDRAELLVLNADQQTGAFDGDLAVTMLGDEANRAAVVAALADQVDTGGWDGLQLDFEELPGDAAPLYSQFAAELRDALPDDATLSVALQPAEDADGYADRGYDLVGLAESVDRVVLMAYDEHGTGFSEAGAVGGLPWTGRVLDALLEEVPAEQVDLGVAQYGYQWIGSTSGSSLTVAQARRAAASTGEWDEEQGEYTARPADGSTLWWSDSRSLTVRAELAADRGLHGVAIWQLSTADPFER